MAISSGLVRSCCVCCRSSGGCFSCSPDLLPLQNRDTQLISAFATSKEGGREGDRRKDWELKARVWRLSKANLGLHVCAIAGRFHVPSFMSMLNLRHSTEGVEVFGNEGFALIGLHFCRYCLWKWCCELITTWSARFKQDWKWSRSKCVKNFLRIQLAWKPIVILWTTVIKLPEWSIVILLFDAFTPLRV